MVVQDPRVGRCVRDRFGRYAIVTTDGPDGVLNDCAFGPDGFPDLYTLNPGWDEILRVDNLNTAEYRAAVLELTRRMYQGWELFASYTLSRVEGDAEDFDQILGNDRTRLASERGVLSYDQTHVVKVSATTFLPSDWRLGGTAQWASGLPCSYMLRQEANDDAGYVQSRRVFVRIGLNGFVPESRNDQRNDSVYTFNVRGEKSFS